MGVGCGGDSGGDTSTTPTEAAVTEPALPEAIPVKGAKSFDLSDRLVREFEIPAGPDWLVDAFGSLWVARDDGIVVRIDPEAGEVEAEISESSPARPLCQGIGAGEEEIYSCPPGADSITRIDPATNEIAGELKVEKLPDQGRLITAAGQLWLLTDSGAAAELTGGEDTVWAMCPLDGQLLRVDAAGGEVTGALALGGAANASVSRSVWVGFEGGVAQVDPDSLEVEAVYEVYPRIGGSLFATPDAVWVREEAGSSDEHFLTLIDPEAQRIVETIEAPDLQSGGDVVVIGDSVWATAYDDQALVELRAR